MDTSTTDTTTNVQPSSSQSTPKKVVSVVPIPTASYNNNNNPNQQQQNQQQQHPLTSSSSRNSSSNSLSGRHAVEIPANAHIFEGIIVSRQDKYGFIKNAINDTRYFFHVNDSDGQTALGAKVSFVVAKDLTTGKEIAYNIVTVEQPVVSLHHHQQQQHMAAQMMAGGGGGYMAHQRHHHHQQQQQQQQPMNGGGMQQAYMMMIMPNGALVPAFNNNTLSPLAFQQQQQQQLMMMNQVNQQINLPIWSSGERRMGRVTLLKKEFGFIKQVNPQRDVFFHFSQLTRMPGGRVNIGDDVEFTPGQDREGKLFAAALTPAAPGLVVFDVIEETLRRGRVVDPPSNTRHYGMTAGLLEFLIVPGDTSSKVKIPFQADELVMGVGGGGGGGGGGNVPQLRMGDHVTFRIATNVAAAEAAKKASNAAAAVLAGRRAVEVTPLMLTGVVVSLSKEPQFGFISYEPDPAAMPKEQPSSSSKDAVPAGGGIHEEDDDGTEGMEQLVEEEEEKKKKKETKATDDADNAGKNLVPPPRRIFFHFKEVIGGIVLKKGDEIIFNLHTNARTGDYNAVKVRRAKAEGGYQPYFSAAAAAGGGEVNGDGSKRVRFKLAGNGGGGGRASGGGGGGGEKAQAVPKMPDDKGGRGFGIGRGRGMQGGLGKKEEPAAPGNGSSNGNGNGNEKEGEEEAANGHYDDDKEEEEGEEVKENGLDIDETLLAKMAALKLAGLPEKAEELLTLSLKRSESCGSLNVAAKEFTPSSMAAVIKKKKK